MKKKPITVHDEWEVIEPGIIPRNVNIMPDSRPTGRTLTGEQKRKRKNCPKCGTRMRPAKSLTTGKVLKYVCPGCKK